MRQPTNGDMVIRISNEILHAGTSHHSASKYQDLDDGDAARYVNNLRRFAPWQQVRVGSDERVGGKKYELDEAAPFSFSRFFLPLVQFKEISHMLIHIHYSFYNSCTTSTTPQRRCLLFLRVQGTKEYVDQHFIQDWPEQA